MDSQMKKDILASMEKNMPKQMGGLLLKRYQELEAAEKEGFKLIKENQELNKEVAKLKTMDRKNYDLTEREKTCKGREKDLIIEDLRREISKQVTDNQVKSANEKVDLMNNLVGLLMRNPQAITTITQSDWHNNLCNPDGSQDRIKMGHEATIITKEEK